MATIANLMIEVQANTSAVVREFDKAQKSVDNLNKTANSGNKKMSDEQKALAQKTKDANEALNQQTIAVAALSVALVAGYKAIANFLMASVWEKSNLIEMQNVVDVTFGTSAKKRMDEWAANAGKNFGLSQLAAKTYIGTLGSMFQSLGLAGDQIEGMSLKLAGLAGDLASFRNLNVDEAFNKIRAGMVGEIEPLRNVGIVLTEVNLEAFALARGVKVQYTQMTEASKVMLRYAYILKQTTNWQGDFVRTQANFANQSRIVTLNMIELKIALGESLYPVLLAGVTLLNAFLEKLVGLAKKFSELNPMARNFALIGISLIMIIPAVTIAIWAFSVAHAWLAKITLVSAGALGVFSKALMTSMGILGVVLIGLALLWDKIAAYKDTNNATRVTDDLYNSFKQLDSGSSDASKGVDELTGSVKQLLGLAGLDELNILSKGSTKSTDFSAELQGLIESIEKEIAGTPKIELGDLIKTEIDWAKVWQNFKDGLQKKVDELPDWFFIDFDVLIADFLADVDWSKLWWDFKTAADKLDAAAFEAIQGLWEKIKEIDWGKVWEGFTDSLDALDAKAYEILVGLWEDIKEIFAPVGQWFGNIFRLAKSAVVSAMTPLINDAQNLWDGIKEVFRGVGQWFGDKFGVGRKNIINVMSTLGSKSREAWFSIKEEFKGVGQWFGDKFGVGRNNVRNVMSTLGSISRESWFNIKEQFRGVGQWFGDKFGVAKNNIVAAFTSLPAWFGNKFREIVRVISPILQVLIDHLNSMIDGFNKISPIIKIPKIPNLPKGNDSGDSGSNGGGAWATGGIVNRKQSNVTVGESGREAILPLDTNTGWMDELADKMSGGVVNVYLDSEQISARVVRNNRLTLARSNGR